MHDSHPIEVSRLTAQEVEARIDRDEPIVFIDSRNENEWVESNLKLPGAVRVEADRVRDHLHEIPRGRGLVPYCAGPNEEASVRVAEELMRQGFADVHALVGGFEAWKRAGRTLEHKPA